LWLVLVWFAGTVKTIFAVPNSDAVADVIAVNE
jgi:hypothetical protein